MCVCVYSARGGGALWIYNKSKEDSAAAKLQASPGQHHRQLSISLHYSAALILLPLSLLNTQLQAKKNKVHSHIQILRQKLRTRTPFCVLHTNSWTVCRRLCVYIYCGSELEGKTACWLSEEGPADSPGPAGVGLKPPADIHTTAAGLIACPSSPKGKASRCCCRCFAAEPSRV